MKEVEELENAEIRNKTNEVSAQKTRVEIDRVKRAVITAK